MKKNLRPAIAMLELIFALVIMGIILLSAPLILDISIRSSNIALQQKSINNAFSRLNTQLSNTWDSQDNTYSQGLDDYTSDPMEFNNSFVISPTNTGIKILTVKIQDDTNTTELDHTITLYAFDCNVTHLPPKPISMNTQP